MGINFKLLWRYRGEIGRLDGQKSVLARPTKLRIVDCGMRIEKETPKNPKSEIRNPK
jgi:hypothetical protein